MENVDLFGSPVLPVVSKAEYNLIGKRAHAHLIAVYGSVDDKCKNCNHLRRYQYSKAFYKCGIADPGSKTGPSGDWRANYQACGKFEGQVFGVGDRVCRSSDKFSVFIGSVVFVFKRTCQIKWDKVASNNQQHSTIHFNNLVKVK